MLKNYIKIAFRTIRKEKLYSTINILGLSVGIASAFLILLWVQDELSYDLFHEKAGRIFRVSSLGILGNSYINHTRTSTHVAGALKNDYPEVEQAVKLTQYQKFVGRYNDKVFNEEKVIAADSAFFDVFSFIFIKGEKSTALHEPGTIVITEETAQRYFGTVDPIGKVIQFNNQLAGRVSGVIENIPANSHIRFDMVRYMPTFNIGPNAGWLVNSFITYIVLKEGFPYQDLQVKLPAFVEKYIYGTTGTLFDSENSWEYILQPLTQIHLYSNLNNEYETNGNIMYVYIFSIVALFIVVIACINFMNLSTAKSASRAKEIGLRKVVGSTRIQLMLQHLSESVFITFLALLLALVMIYVSLPEFNTFAGKDLQFSLFGNPLDLLKLIGIVFFVGILSGSYPAIFLSSFPPVSVISGKLRQGFKNSTLRNALVVFQFGTAISLFAGTFIVGDQLDFVQNKTLGFNKDQVLIIKNVNSLGSQSDAFKNTLRQNANITSVSGSRPVPGQFFPNFIYRADNSQNISLKMFSSDPEYIETMRLEMKEGRFFSHEFSTDSTAIILNETAVNMLNWDNPIGKTLTPGGSVVLTVIGIVKDFNFESLHTKIRPMAMVRNIGPHGFRESFINARVNAENIEETIAEITKAWDTFSVSRQFEYSFLSEDYRYLYNDEMRTGKIFTIFSFLAVFIASLGLFGLALFTAEQRTKEVGVRKVLGANNSNIFVLLSKEFVKWVLISNLIAWPVTYYLMDLWLQDFAYRVSIGLTPFILSAFLALFIAFFTVSFQSIKAANTNPIDSLRYE